MTHRRRRQLGGVRLSVLLGIVVGLVLFALGVTVFRDVAPPILVGIDFNLGKTVSWIGVLLVVFPLMNALFVQRLHEAIQERTEHLEKTFSEAENLRARMDTMKAEYEERLAATEAEARETIQAQIREAQDLRQQLMAEATAKADELVKKAEVEIDQEKQRVLTELRVRAVDLTLSAAEKLIGENMDSAVNRKLVTEFIDKVEVPG